MRCWGDGLAQDANGNISLRAAIEEGNHANSGPNVTITLNVAGTISLTTALPNLGKNYNINGPGYPNLTIERSTAPGTAQFRIFTLTGANTSTSLSGMAIENGDAPVNSFNGNGGAILVIQPTANLILDTCEIVGNRAAGSGGGIYATGGLDLYDSVILLNETAGIASHGAGLPSSDRTHF